VDIRACACPISLFQPSFFETSLAVPTYRGFSSIQIVYFLPLFFPPLPLFSSPSLASATLRFFPQTLITKSAAMRARSSFCSPKDDGLSPSPPSFYRPFLDKAPAFFPGVILSRNFSQILSPDSYVLLWCKLNFFSATAECLQHCFPFSPCFRFNSVTTVTPDKGRGITPSILPPSHFLFFSPLVVVPTHFFNIFGPVPNPDESHGLDDSIFVLSFFFVESTLYDFGPGIGNIETSFFSSG